MPMNTAPIPKNSTPSSTRVQLIIAHTHNTCRKQALAYLLRVEHRAWHHCHTNSIRLVQGHSSLGSNHSVCTSVIVLEGISFKVPLTSLAKVKPRLVI
jgi:hypothetical protein